MAPILKEVEAPVATATTTASANVSAAPRPKAPADAPARPQPVALEIPVTVNGARTVDGSDKREPFSESSQTVLVFPLGAVIRITTPLAPGQLVFLTNEKTKKEVVCQVVKSKSAGSGSNYVELQFTESANGFWGLLVPSSPAAPAAPRPVAPAAPAVPKAISPVVPVAAKPILPKPVAPAANVSAPAKPVLPLPPSPVVRPEPAAPQSAAPITPAPPVGAAPPSVTPVPELKPQPTSPPVDVAPKLEAAPQIPHMPHPATPVVPALPLRDFSKEIDALFAVPQAPESKPTSTANAEPISTAASSSPSSEELKQQAARLQEQLSSLLFTETPAVPPPASVSPAAPKKESPVADVAKKILEIAQEQPKPAVKHEPTVTPLARKPVPAPLVEAEEVRIPAWLAPISQSSHSAAVAPAASEEADSTTAVSVNSEESFDALVVDAPLRSEAAVFGGQLLGESAATAEHQGTGSSKKGLFIGLAAAVILALAGGGWYYWQNFSSSTTTAASRPANVSSSAALAAVSNSPAVAPVPTPATSSVNPSAAASAPASLQPAKNPPSPATQPVPAPVSEAKTSNSTARNNVAAVESPKKPDLGDVHLAAPVVNRSADTQQAAELPAIESNASPAGSDPLADVHRKEPAVPLPVGGEVKSAQLIKSVSPVYPPMAKSQRLSGNVQIDALIDASGNVASMKVLSGPPVLHKAALDAVKQWKYAPAQLDGEPTSMHLTVTVQFRNQ